MDRAALTRMQIRVVRTVFRAEVDRLRRKRAGDVDADALARLRTRSLELLDHARAELNGEAAKHPELLEEIEAARAQVTDAAEVSAGSRGDRPG